MISDQIALHSVQLPLFIYLFNRFHQDYNAKMRLEKEIHLNKSQQRETKVRDTQQSEAPTLSVPLRKIHKY